jgi:hypothetical protein
VTVELCRKLMLAYDSRRKHECKAQRKTLYSQVFFGPI